MKAKDITQNPILPRIACFWQVASQMILDNDISVHDSTR